MKKLEDIPKNNPFKVPDGYFDRLPGVIQARVAESPGLKETKPYMRYALQYALPVLVLAVASVVYFVPRPSQDVDSMLASISTEELVSYLRESEVSHDELLNEIEVDMESVEAIEDEVFMNSDAFKNLDVLDLDLNNL